MDLKHLQTWMGQMRTEEDNLSLRHARLMAATLGLDPERLQSGDPLPPLWHWIYFLEGQVPERLGRDGHPARGGFLPPVPLSNRMWAGGRLEFFAPLPLGQAVQKRSQVLSVEHKRGRSGDLVFVTVEHEVWCQGRRALREEHDIVYKEPSPSHSTAALQAAPFMGTQQRPVQVNSTTLFRYSALTFNGHRIHYDADYCRQVEGYAQPVIHGPLSATLLANWAQDIAPRALSHFVYRGLSPSLLGDTLTLQCQAHESDPDALQMWINLSDGRQSMQATARFAAR
jgi:3-methylfumaryl-CoA hydratase